MIRSINSFYFDEQRNVLIISSEKQHYVKSGDASLLLSELCEANGRNLRGSIALFQKCNHAVQKPGVLVNPSYREIYFPTHSSKNPECIWINFGKIHKLKSLNGTQCRIQFMDGSEQIVNCSRKVVRNQMIRCDFLLKSLHNPYDILSDSTKLM